MELYKLISIEDEKWLVEHVIKKNEKNLTYDFFDKTNLYFKNIEAVEQLKKIILERYSEKLKPHSVRFLAIEVDKDDVKKFKKVTTCYDEDQNKLITYDIPFSYISRDNINGIYARPKVVWYSNETLMNDLEEALNLESNGKFKI